MLEAWCKSAFVANCGDITAFFEDGFEIMENFSADF